MSNNNSPNGGRRRGSSNSQAGLSCMKCSPIQFTSSNEDEPRGCTDIIFLIIYVLFCLLMIVIAVFAMVYGNPLRLINGMDSFGNVCGMWNDYDENQNFTGLDLRDKPYVLFFDLSHMEESRKICVQKCPDREISDESDLKQYFNDTGVSLCQYDFDISKLNDTTTQGASSIIGVMCAQLPYPESTSILKRCIPRRSRLVESQMESIYGYLNGLNILKQILGDLAQTWVTVLGLSAVSFLISFLLVMCIHWMTGVISYIILLASAALSIAFTAFLWMTYADIRSELNLTPLDEQLEESAKNEHAFLTYSIISTIFTLILLCIVIYLRTRVKVVVKLFREASSALTSMPCLVIQPILTYLILTVYLLGWLLIILCIATSDTQASRSVSLFGRGTRSGGGVAESLTGQPSSTEDPHHHHADSPEAGQNRTISADGIAVITVLDYSESTWVKYMWWVYVIGLVWVSEFILACQQMVIASSISTWYFSRDRGSLRCVIVQSIRRLIQYHLGSMALGALLITLLKVPRLLLAFLHRVLRKWEDFRFVKIIATCCCCCLRCFENGLRRVHHNAYTVISIQGVNFCPASRLALQALVGNALQLSVINSIGDFVLFLAKCVTSASTGLIALIIFRHNENLYFYAIPVLFTVVFSYFVAHCVISVFEMAVDTLFLCFCEDYNMNDTTESKNYYAPSSLLQYMTEDAPASVTRSRRSSAGSPIPRKVRPSDDPNTIGEELMPMRSQTNVAENA